MQQKEILELRKRESDLTEQVDYLKVMFIKMMKSVDELKSGQV